MKKISILGSTGSIGTQALEVAKNLNIDVIGLSCNDNIKLLEEQVKMFHPKFIAVGNEALADEIKNQIDLDETQVLSGIEGFIKIATLKEVDTVIASIVGIAGLLPVYEAIRAGKNIGLANKETLVTAGEIIINEAKNKNVKILPIDSEHSAIFQCLMGNNIKNVSKIILTASGGPFRGKSKNDLESISVEDALNHPNWSMGSKITIDSATLMNKGLEVIEAKWLFDLDINQIDVLIHPQSIIHSMVEYIDGSVMAQMGVPDMKIPIQLALTYPDRLTNNFEKLNLLKTKNLSFEYPDLETFECLKLAIQAIKIGKTMPVVLNAANEAAVALFLQRKIKFNHIPRIIENSMGKHIVNTNPNINDIVELDKFIKHEVFTKF